MDLENNGNFAALINAVILEIPYVSKVTNFLVAIDSKEFQQESIKLFNALLMELSKYSGSNAERERAIWNVALEGANHKLKYIEEGEASEYHNAHCTCFNKRL